jgi:hypothetical protein
MFPWVVMLDTKNVPSISEDDQIWMALIKFHFPVDKKHSESVVRLVIAILVQFVLQHDYQ